MNGAPVKPTKWLGLLGLILIFMGSYLAYSVRTSEGVSVSDIRFMGAGGTEMSALLYVPKNASAENPVPGILAVHGYINSRETQDGFSIEFARRGYVVLAIDQTGHGYSGGAAFSNGFGGPDGLAYLRSLPMVDKNQIGLEGHSMGGWTILAAAKAMPDAYQSMVLEGSSTGAPFAAEGTQQWPRNLALVFSRYDEFSTLMWGVDRAIDTPNSEKLQALFGTNDRVVEGQIYGNQAEGSARVLFQPNTTHPGDHFSNDAIGRATDWFAKTLKGGTPKPVSDQIWIWKEIGTGLGLIGFVMLILGTFDWLIRFSPLSGLRAIAIPGREQRDKRYRNAFLRSAFVPALLFFPAFIAVSLLVPPSVLLPQTVTTQVALWALAGASISFMLRRFAKRGPDGKQPPWVLSIGSAIATIAVAYTVVLIVDNLFHVDLRFWVVAVKFPSLEQWGVVAIYVLPITLAFIETMRSMASDLTVSRDSPMKLYMSSIAAMSLGFILLLGVIYGLFFMTGTLITGFDPLTTVIGIQFVPLLIAISIIGTFTWRRTGSYRPGALIIGILVTLYVVAGTATQVVGYSS